MIWRVRGRSAFREFNPPRGTPAIQCPSRVRAGPFLITGVARRDALPPRVAYAISRRVGNAVVRNRLRRQLRAIVAELSPTIRPGMYLIGAAPTARQLDFRELRQVVVQGFGALADVEARRERLARRRAPEGS